MPPVRPGDGLQPGAVRAGRLPLPAAQGNSMTTLTLTARPAGTRLRPPHATGDSAARYVSLRLECFLTFPLTCCAAPAPGMIVVNRQ
jgi:hypothetical protein